MPPKRRNAEMNPDQSAVDGDWEDEFVSKIVRDPENPPATLMVMAYIGKSAKVDNVRLYLDAELGGYVDIERTSIIHVQKVPTSVSALGGAYVWIERRAELLTLLQNEYVRSKAKQQAQAG
jgi:hypothetical protein